MAQYYVCKTCKEEVSDWIYKRYLREVDHKKRNTTIHSEADLDELLDL